MTMKLSFSYNPFVKLSLDIKGSLMTRAIHMNPKYGLIKELHCNILKTSVQ